MEENLKVGIIGLGEMGRHHLRVWSAMDGVEVVAACDSNQDRLRERLKRHDPHQTRRYLSSTLMFEKEALDAVSICVPTQKHHQEAIMALKAGCHVLLEKPIAKTLNQAKSLHFQAQLEGRILAIGHIERYNPAIITAREHCYSYGIIRAIHARRVGPNPERVRDVGVVLDLAVHDIDLIHWISGQIPSVLYSRLYHCNHGPKIEDGADILLDYGGIAAFLTTNWLTTAKIRDLTIICDQATIIVDLLHKKTQLWKTYTEVEEVRHPGREPLALEISNFIDATKGIKGAEIVTPEEAIVTLECAREILTMGAKNG